MGLKYESVYFDGDATGHWGHRLSLASFFRGMYISKQRQKSPIVKNSKQWRPEGVEHFRSSGVVNRDGAGIFGSGVCS